MKSHKNHSAIIIPYIVSFSDEFDPLSFKANIDGFMAAGKEVDDDDDDKKETESDDDDDEDIIEDINEEDEEKTKAKPGVYKPPKLVPTYYGKTTGLHLNFNALKILKLTDFFNRIYLRFGRDARRASQKADRQTGTTRHQ